MNGLTTKAARERLKQDGENELAAAAKLHPLRMFLGQFRDVKITGANKWSLFGELA